MTSESKKKMPHFGRTVKVRVPGTSANCGAGFDTLGLACTIYNELELTLNDNSELIIENFGDGADDIPKDESNMVWQAIKTTLKKAEVDSDEIGGHLRMWSEVPLSRGLGSSATAIVAGIKAANELMDGRFSDSDMLQIATGIEGHPDNVAPAIYGGFTVSVVTDGVAETMAFMPRFDMHLVVAVPDFPLSTKAARDALPKMVPLKDAVFNVGHAAMLVGALASGDDRFLHHAFEDALHQPYRAKLIPGMSDVFDAAKKAGALGATISGAGSSLIAYTLENERAVGDAMLEAFARNGVNAKVLYLEVDRHGAHVVNE